MSSDDQPSGGSGPSDRVAECIQFMTQVQGELVHQEKVLREKQRDFEMKIKMGELELQGKENAHKTRVHMEKVELRKNRAEFEELKCTCAFISETGKQHMITLDVGGDKFSTDVRTLERHPDSIFPRIARAMDGRYLPRVFIDRDSKHFRFILNYMRQGEEVFRGTALRGKDKYDLEEMVCEARYYRLNGFMNLLKRHQIRLERKPISFKELLTGKCFSAPNPKILRYETAQQLLFKERNMMGIVFENVHFKHPVSFEDSVLDGAMFKHCRFDAVVTLTNADISRVSFDQCVNVTPDRFVMDGNIAKKWGVTINPGPVDLTEFSVTYTA